MRKGFIGRKKLGVKTSALLIGLLLLTAISPLFTPAGFSFFPYLLASGLYLIVMIRMAVFSAGSITVEKEARTWPILLATPLEDKEIVRGKAIAAFRRNLPLLLLYFVLICILFMTARGLSAHATFLQIVGRLLFSVFSIVGPVLFVIGAGLYFGVRCRTTSAAVAATVGSYLAVQYIFGIAFTAFSWLVLRVALGGGSPWIPYATSTIHGLFLVLTGLLLERRAARQVRRKIF
jgi:ABC-type transport system involved in multi-copper enzyme maturation permease subunit